MRRLLILPVLCAAVSAVGCATGCDPKSIDYKEATYKATEPEQTLGVTPGAKKALMIPADVLGCATTWGADILQATAKAGYCVLNTITPPPVTPVSKATKSASLCAPPPPKAAPVCAPVPSAAPVCAPCGR